MLACFLECPKASSRYAQSAGGQNVGSKENPRGVKPSEKPPGTYMRRPVRSTNEYVRLLPRDRNVAACSPISHIEPHRSPRVNSPVIQTLMKMYQKDCVVLKQVPVGIPDQSLCCQANALDSSLMIGVVMMCAQLFLEPLLCL